MIEIFFIFIIIAPIIFLGIMYFIGKKLGDEKIVRIFIMVLLFIHFLFIGIIIFEDELFFKSDARDILAGQNIVLKDDFEIKDNDISGGIGEYYQTFVLEISAEDNKD